MRLSVRVLNCGRCPFYTTDLVTKRPICSQQENIKLQYDWVPKDCKFRGKYIDNGPVEVL